MGTINTAEVAKKNPAVYVEMVQRKAELDLIALENSKQLSLMYLESYANANNLTQEEKTHLENMIERKVLLEAAKTEGGVFSKIVNAFKRLWQWLFGTKETKIKPEDMNNKVQPKFDLNDAEKYIGSIEGDMSKLSNCRTKADVDRNKGDIVKTVDTLKTITTTASTTYVTLSVVKGILDKIHGTMGSVSSMCEKSKESFEREMAKYNTTSSGSDNSNDNSDNADSENNKKLEELREAQKEVEKQYSDVLSQLTTLSTEIKRLIKEGTSDSEGKSNNDDDSDEDEKNKKPTDPDVQDMLDYTGGSSSNSSGSKGGGNTPATKWINQFHYTYTDEDFNNGKVKISIGKIPEAMKKKDACKRAIDNLTDGGNNTSLISVTYDELLSIIDAYNSSYKPGKLPSDYNKLQVSKLKDELKKKYGEALADYIFKTLYGDIKSTNGVNVYHIKYANWKKVTDNAMWKVVAEYKGKDTEKFVKDLFNKETKKNGGGYNNKLNDDQNKTVKNIVNTILSSDSISPSERSKINANLDSNAGDMIGTIVKKWLKINKSGDPAPFYYIKS